MRRVRLTWLVLLALLALSPARAGAQSDAASELATDVATALDTNTPRVSIDATGDTTVTFAIRNVDDDPAAVRDGAVADTFTVLRAVYASEAASAVRTLTVLGTFPFKGTKSPGVRPTPVLRAVLSADRAASLDWSTLAPADVPDVVDTWWLQGAFANVGTSDDAGAPTDPRMAVAVAHLDASLAALDSGQLGVGRSQFTQFFDSWDEVSDDVGQRFPADYNTIDADLERAEVALLHTQPEDIGAARAALMEIRASLARVSSSS